MTDLPASRGASSYPDLGGPALWSLSAGWGSLAHRSSCQCDRLYGLTGPPVPYPLVYLDVGDESSPPVC